MLEHSAVVIPFRHRHALQIFWAQRQPHLKFLGGFHGFVGGRVEEQDFSADVRGVDAESLPWVACAARELFEECGVWVGIDGVSWVRSDVVDGSRFEEVGEWTSAEHHAVGHFSKFYMVDLTDFDGTDDLPDKISDEELVHGEWITPNEALQRWHDSRAFISLPVRMVLGQLASAQRPDLTLGPVEISTEELPGVRVLPIVTPTLLPATHTNCAIVGHAKFVVIDPGSPEEREQARLNELIDALIASGGRFGAVVLTHHHPDHVMGVDVLVQRYGVGVWAHPRTGSRLGLTLERELYDGDRIELGADSLDVVFTPGHADGHLAFLHARTQLVIAGDLISSIGTILVDPEDGNMGDYLDSLKTVLELEPRALLPAHGWIIVEPQSLLRTYIAHRNAREAMVFEALKELGESTAESLTPLAYRDAPAHIWPIAQRSVMSHLIHLVELGKAVRVGDCFDVRTPPEL